VNWDSVFLGAIAAATLVMAIVQIGAAVAGARLAKRLEQLADEVHREIRPLVARATEVADEARRAAALAGQQVERVDRRLYDVSQRVTDTAEVLQRTVVGPIREGSAILAGLKAGFEALRGVRSSRSTRVEDEDALFIG
jgi:replicative DNA helicase